MDLNLKDKSVIVAAGSKGLGKATATEFAKEGAKVVIASRSEAELKKAAEEIKQLTGNPSVKYQVCDITSPEQIKLLVHNTAAWYGTVDVLINNAGGPPAGNFDDFLDEDWQKAYELNLLSFIRLIREVLPYMRENGAGRIINLASSSIKEPIDNLILSNTFRAGIVGLSKSLSQELAADQILINTVGPGRIATDRIMHLDELTAEEAGLSQENIKEQYAKQIPLGRYGEPAEFAKVVCFLGSFANTYVTGQSLLVDGGLVKAL